jgi:hypothetical protein
MEAAALILFPVVLLAAVAWAVTREDTRLRRRARRYRQLELEGIEELRRDDPYPEQAAVRGAYLREPDGSATDGDRVLHDELERIRDHTRRKGAMCLL